MLIDSIFLLVSLVLLFFGAEGLVRGSSSLALRLGLTPLVIGLTVVAFGTSAPELFVSVSSVIQGQDNIAVGNVVGSNIFNIAVILGLSALITPVKVNLSVIKIDAPVMIVITGIFAVIAMTGEISRFTGVVFLLGLCGYIVFNFYMANSQKETQLIQEGEDVSPRASTSIYRDIFLIVAGLGILVAGSQLLVYAASHFARALGISEAVIGLTIVAAGTSIPELATSMIAALRNEADIAVGNVVGSNVFNILCILGASATVKPVFAPGITTLDLGVMVGFSIGLFPLLWTGKKLQRWEGALLLTGYVIYLWTLWPT